MKNVLLFLTPMLLAVTGVLLGVFVGGVTAALFIALVIGFGLCAILGTLLVDVFGD